MFEAVCKLGLEGHCVKDAQCALSLWAVEKLDQVEKPEGTCSDARDRRRVLGTKEATK